MPKYLRPRRGTLANANSNSLLLKKGEMFLEYPAGDVGNAPAKLMIGNGVAQYSSSNPVSADTSGSSTNSFAPALIHPVLYRPKFTDSNPSTESWTFNSGTAAINNINPWVSTSNQGKTLPDIIGNIKQALVNHADSLNYLNEDLHYANYIDTESSDLNDFTEQGYYVFRLNSVTANHPSDWSIAYPFVLQVIRDENAKHSRVSNNLDCQQIIYYDSNIYTRYAKWQNVPISGGGTIFKLVWSEWCKYVDENTMFDIIYPVGSVYTTADKDFNPNNVFYGTWENLTYSENFYLKGMPTGSTYTGTFDGTNNRNISHSHSLPFFSESYGVANFSAKQPWNFSARTTANTVTSPNYASFTRTPTAQAASAYQLLSGNNILNNSSITNDNISIEPAHYHVNFWLRTA